MSHDRIAAAIADALGLPGSDDTWTLPLPPLPVPTGPRAAMAEVRWGAAFLGPWPARRVRGRSSGDGRTAKRPDLLPWAAAPDSPATLGQVDLTTGGAGGLGADA